MTGDLFSWAEGAAGTPVVSGGGVAPRGLAGGPLSHTLRYYQEEAVEAVFREWETNSSTLAVLATGLGKTQIFCEVAARANGRVLVLAHRDELVQQAVRRLEGVLGEMVGVEQAQLRGGRCRVVVGSVQTVYRDDRIRGMQAHGDFDVVIADEAHHYAAKTYAKAIMAWEGAKVLGVTATPDRGDKKALGRIFDSVAYQMGIVEGVQAGYLTPIHGRQVHVEEIDISGVASTAGDLVRAQLDNAVLKGVEAIVQVTLDEWGDNCGIAFFPGKRSAAFAAERFNAIKPGCAAVITDDTPRDERREIIAACHRGAIQYLCNCMIATEGFDWPEAEIMICGRPTKSRALYAQMVGRVTRVLPGLVDAIPGREGSDARRSAIASSAKPRCLVVDFVGNSGRHDLASVVDVLGGKWHDAERQAVKRKLKKGGEVDPLEAVKQAQEELKALAKKAQAKVTAKVTPFDVFGMKDMVGLAMSGGPATEAQIRALLLMGIPAKDVQGISKNQATKLIGTAAKRRQVGLASFKQMRLLARHGVTRTNVTKREACAAIDYLASRGWGRDPSFDPNVFRKLAGDR